MKKILLLILPLLFCSSTADYLQFYSHVKEIKKVRVAPMMEESDYFLIFLVDAKRFDYTDSKTFFRTLAKSPSSGSKAGSVGHAWIYLQGKGAYLEGGFSGELGLSQPKYFDGVLTLSEKGDPNPVRYLWEVQPDGFFQQGNGGHRPTFAAKINLTKEQHDKMRAFIDSYRFERYSLVENQCASFVSYVAKFADLDLETHLTMPIEQCAVIDGKPHQLWADPRFSKITFSTPDVLERELVKLVKEGKAEYALHWYSYYCGDTVKQKLERANETLTHSPSRLRRLFRTH